MTVRKFGYLPTPRDEEHEAKRTFKLSRAAALPDKVDLTWALDGVIYDQGSLSDCCGWGVGGAWHARARIQGDKTVAHPDPLGIYCLALAEADGNADTPLIDIGTFPRLVLDVLDTLGAAPMGAWPLTSAQSSDGTLKRPDIAYFQQSFDRRKVRYVALSGADDCAAALAAGYPVVCAGAVDQSFMDYIGGVWHGMQGRSIGGHCVKLLGYSPDDAPWRKFRLVNSWGTGWGEDGMMWIANSAVDAMELWAVEVAPS